MGKQGLVSITFSAGVCFPVVPATLALAKQNMYGSRYIVGLRKDNKVNDYHLSGASL